MSLDNISNQYDILMADSSSKSEKKDAYRILTDYARVQNVSEAWMLLALYYVKTKKPLGVSFFTADRYHKALECSNAACQDDEWRDSASMLILSLLTEGSTKNNFKAHTLARDLLEPPFHYDYEQQKMIFQHMIPLVIESVNRGEVLPKVADLDRSEIDAFVETWTQYQNRYRRSRMEPEEESRMMHQSYAYAHFLWFEHYLETKLQQGCQGAYWAYGVIFLNNANHTLRPMLVRSEEHKKFESVFMNGLMENQLGALRAIVELYYEEKAVLFFSDDTVRQAVYKLKELYPDEYESMRSGFIEDGIKFPYH